jgi:hypothetical protein
MDFDILINRFSHDRCHEKGYKQTRGILTVFKDEQPIFTCVTLELPWRDNKRFVSSIPTGTYDWVMLNNTPTFNYTVLHILNVPDRSGILIHSGNYIVGDRVDSQGCPLVGKEFAHLNNDDWLDVTESRPTMAELGRVLEKDVGITKGRIKIYQSYE